jgi:hypothetical protein
MGGGRCEYMNGLASGKASELWNAVLNNEAAARLQACCGIAKRLNLLRPIVTSMFDVSCCARNCATIAAESSIPCIRTPRWLRGSKCDSGI